VQPVSTGFVSQPSVLTGGKLVQPLYDYYRKTRILGIYQADMQENNS
jgi:hypothetical protein